VQQDPACGSPTFGMGLGTVSADATHVYWYDNRSSAGYRLAKAGGTPEVVDSTQSQGFEFLLDPGGLYKISSGRVESTPVAGGCPTTLADSLPLPRALALDATYVYWSDQASQTKPTKILKVPR
jgi:hypothetical protein